jgi:hypothetical protein
MTKLIFNTVAVFLTWILGHAFLFIYLNRLLPYATINLFTAVLWLVIIVFSHYCWVQFMGDKAYKLYKS